MMRNYTFLSKDPSQWDESCQSLWGCHNIYPLLKQFHITQVTQPGAFFPHWLMGMGWLWKILQWYDISVGIAQREFAGERMYGLAVVVVHPCQARVPTLDDVARKTCLAHLFQPQLALCFHAFQWGCPSHSPPQRRVTWVPWLMGYLATSHVGRSTN